MTDVNWPGDSADPHDLNRFVLRKSTTTRGACRDQERSQAVALDVVYLPAD